MESASFFASFMRFDRAERYPRHGGGVMRAVGNIIRLQVGRGQFSWRGRIGSGRLACICCLVQQSLYKSGVYSTILYDASLVSTGNDSSG